MYTLEIETRNKLKTVQNPRKARYKDCILYDAIQVMDNDGKWHTVIRGVITYESLRMKIVEDINDAIKRRDTLVYIDI